MNKSTILLCASLLLSVGACAKSELDRCIDAQMAVWEKDVEEYSQREPSQDKPAVNEPSVEIGGVMVPGDWTPYLGPPDEEDARADANIKCGKVYARR